MISVLVSFTNLYRENSHMIINIFKCSSLQWCKECSCYKPTKINYKKYTSNINTDNCCFISWHYLSITKNLIWADLKNLTHIYSCNTNQIILFILQNSCSRTGRHGLTAGSPGFDSLSKAIWGFLCWHVLPFSPCVFPLGTLRKISSHSPKNTVRLNGDTDLISCVVVWWTVQVFSVIV